MEQNAQEDTDRFLEQLLDSRHEPPLFCLPDAIPDQYGASINFVKRGEMQNSLTPALLSDNSFGDFISFFHSS